MKVTFNFDNPLNPKQKLKRTLRIRGRKSEYYLKKLLDLSDNGMIIVPVEVLIEGENKIKRTIFVSSTSDENNYKLKINPRNKKIENTKVVIEQLKDYNKDQYRKSTKWRGFFRELWKK